VSIAESRTRCRVTRCTGLGCSAVAAPHSIWRRACGVHMPHLAASASLRTPRALAPAAALARSKSDRPLEGYYVDRSCSKWSPRLTFATFFSATCYSLSRSGKKLRRGTTAGLIGPQRVSSEPRSGTSCVTRAQRTGRAASPRSARAKPSRGLAATWSPFRGGEWRGVSKRFTTGLLAIVRDARIALLRRGNPRSAHSCQSVGKGLQRKKIWRVRALKLGQCKHNAEVQLPQ